MSGRRRPDGQLRAGDKVAPGSSHLTGPWCAVTRPNDDPQAYGNRRYVCTRDPGHGGQHEAHGANDIRKVWPA